MEAERRSNIKVLDESYQRLDNHEYGTVFLNELTEFPVSALPTEQTEKVISSEVHYR